MENGQNEALKVLPGKKELKNQLADKMEAALPELREMLGDKKFANRVKKAAKLLIDGLHIQDAAKNKKQQPKKATAKETTSKKSAAKGNTAKKVTIKKAATKTANPVTSKKAKTVAKKGSGKK